MAYESPRTRFVRQLAKAVIEQGRKNASGFVLVFDQYNLERIIRQVMMEHYPPTRQEMVEAAVEIGDPDAAR